MKDEFLKKLKTAKILRITMIVLAVVWAISYDLNSLKEKYGWFI